MILKLLIKMTHYFIINNKIFTYNFMCSLIPMFRGFCPDIDPDDGCNAI